MFDLERNKLDCLFELSSHHDIFCKQTLLYKQIDVLLIIVQNQNLVCFESYQVDPNV